MDAFWEQCHGFTVRAVLTALLVVIRSVHSAPTSTHSVYAPTTEGATTGRLRDTKFFSISPSYMIFLAANVVEVPLGVAQPTSASAERFVQYLIMPAEAASRYP